MGVGDEFAQKLKSFCGESSCDKRRPRDVAAGPVKACDEAIGDRVATICEYNWNGAGSCLSGTRRYRRSKRKDHVDRTSDQFGCQRRQPVELSPRPFVIDNDVLTLDKACFLDTGAERCE